jgi:hypothetical protein
MADLDREMQTPPEGGVGQANKEAIRLQLGAAGGCL